MKKFFTLITLSLIMAVAVSAQDYKPFRVGLGLGYAMASGTGSSGGVLLALEPSYRLQDNLSLGFRIESAIITTGFSGTAATINASASALGSYTLNAQYYVGSGDSKFRPFVGAGLGMYTLAAVSVASIVATGGAAAVPAVETVFGFYPRAGFDLGHFNVTLDYNLVPATKFPGGEISNSYFGIRLGAYFGGGKN